MSWHHAVHFFNRIFVLRLIQKLKGCICTKMAQSHHCATHPIILFTLSSLYIIYGIPDVHRPQVCITDGTKYSEGETFVASNCSQCLCKDGAITCTSLLCPHQPCSVMIRRRDQCCPVCYNGLVFPGECCLL